jgi:hypothetical protein
MDGEMKNSTFLPLHRNSFSKEEEKEVILQEGDVITRNSTDSIDRPRHNTWVKELFARSVEVRGVLQLHFGLGAVSTYHLPGISPVPQDQRVRHPYSKTFFVWFSMNFNILS